MAKRMVYLSVVFFPPRPIPKRYIFFGLIISTVALVPILGVSPVFQIPPNCHAKVFATIQPKAFANCLAPTITKNWIWFWTEPMTIIMCHASQNVRKNEKGKKSSFTKKKNT
jgi:hypothetical protein